MSWLLDTCVLSEFARPQPEPRVTDWLAAQVEDDLYTSVVVLGELARGVALLPDGSKEGRLGAWLHADLRQRFGARILPVTTTVAVTWGELSGAASRAGRQVNMADGLVAATGIAHDLVVVTRNAGPLAETGAAVFDPWTDHEGEPAEGESGATA